MKTLRLIPLGSALLGFFFICVAAPAQGPGDDVTRGTVDGRLAARQMAPDDFGIGRFNVLTIPAASFVGKSSSVTWTLLSPAFQVGGGYLRATGLTGEFVAGVALPEGALIRRLVLYYDDASGSQSVLARLYALSGWDDTNTASTLLASVSSPTGPAGKAVVLSTAISHTVENSALAGGAHYVAYVFCPKDSGFRAVEIWWERQMSAAPTTATFADVSPSHLFFRAIEALAQSEITSGCGSGNFCPDQPVTRGEVAKFLARALGLSYNLEIDFNF